MIGNPIALPLIPVGPKGLAITIQRALLAHSIISSEPDPKVAELDVGRRECSAALHDERMPPVNRVPLRWLTAVPVVAPPRRRASSTAWPAMA